MKKPKKTKATTSTRDTDASLEILDAALTSAEEQLRNLIPAMKPYDIAVQFEGHVRRHLNVELTNIADHGHRNDDPEDKPEDSLFDVVDSPNNPEGKPQAPAIAQTQSDLLQDVRAALRGLLDQVYQMQGMFGDEDGNIAGAVSDAEEALEVSRAIIRKTEQAREITKR